MEGKFKNKLGFILDIVKKLTCIYLYFQKEIKERKWDKNNI